MRPIYALNTRTPVGWLSGDVLLNPRHEPCAFVRGREVFTFTRRHVGVYDNGLFRDAGGDMVGAVGRADGSIPAPRRRRRFQITPRFGFSVPAPRSVKHSRPWAIWDASIERLSF